MKVYLKQNNAYIGEYVVDTEGVLQISNDYCLVKVLDSKFPAWKVCHSTLTKNLSDADLRKIGLRRDDSCWLFHKRNIIIAQQKVLEVE